MSKLRKSSQRVQEEVAWVGSTMMESQSPVNEADGFLSLPCIVSWIRCVPAADCFTLEAARKVGTNKIREEIWTSHASLHDACPHHNQATKSSNFLHGGREGLSSPSLAPRGKIRLHRSSPHFRHAHIYGTLTQTSCIKVGPIHWQPMANPPEQSAKWHHHGSTLGVCKTCWTQAAFVPAL